jgi:hypothetical protein
LLGAGCSKQAAQLLMVTHAGETDSGIDAGIDAGSVSDAGTDAGAGPDSGAVFDAGPCSSDLNRDPKNCGACGFVCSPDANCAAGSCVCDTSIDGGGDLILCDGGCVHANSDQSNCGYCGNACRGQQSCQAVTISGTTFASCDGDFGCIPALGCANPLETCDPNSGYCVCGIVVNVCDAGLFPPRCVNGAFCASIDGGAKPHCYQPCDLYAQNCPWLPPPDGGLPDASVIQACYYEPFVNALVCETVNLQSHESLACNQNSDCTFGQDCFPLSAAELDAGFVRACRYACDEFDGGQHFCPDTGERKCVPVSIVSDDAGTTTAVGACQPKY